MPFNKFLRKYMFPVPKTKTIRNILEILVGDWKYTGTLNSNFAILSWSRHLTPFGLEFAMNNIMRILECIQRFFSRVSYIKIWIWKNK